MSTTALRRIITISAHLPNAKLTLRKRTSSATQKANISTTSTSNRHDLTTANMSTTKTMKAVVIREPGGPEVLKVEQIPIPTPKPGQVLIAIKAFGLNRSELFTRQGHSSDVVKFPRVLGIECCGLVEEAPGGEFQKGDKVVTAMGGLGRTFDGGYAEYTCPPANQVMKIETSLE